MGDKVYDSIVVGSGASGLAMALILGLSGNRVLMIEKAASVGGSLKRFTKGGISFDVGMHFTGGVENGGVLWQCLKALGLSDRIETVFFDEDNANKMFFLDEGISFTLPYGNERLREKLIDYFPDQAAAVSKYLSMVKGVCDRTPSMRIGSVGESSEFIDEDSISLADVLLTLTGDRALRALLSAFSICYGVSPYEVSFANHARVAQMLYNSQCTFKGGGNALVDSFLDAFKAFDIEVRTQTEITGFGGIKDGKVGNFELSDGTVAEAGNCVLTIHPSSIMKILPLEHFKKAFISRVGRFEPSVGFFTIFGTLGGGSDRDAKPEVYSIYQGLGDDGLLGSRSADGWGISVMKGNWESSRRPFYILEPAYVEDTRPWEDSLSGSRPEQYYDYKRERQEYVLGQLNAALPGEAEGLDIACTASTLTYRDYLNSPDGTAYGIKQKMGQFNLVGKLALTNLFVAGQSSLLPGVAGAIMSSFIVAHRLLGDQRYESFLKVNYGS